MNREKEKNGLPPINALGTQRAGKMIHSGETLPVTMHSINTQRDEVREFDEVSCARGGLGLLRGAELMYLILNYTDRGKLWGSWTPPSTSLTLQDTTRRSRSIESPFPHRSRICVR